MAKLPELVRALALATHTDESSVKVLARSLREAGWIRTAGRGRSGADMAPSDAASMVIGLATLNEWTHASAAVERLVKCAPVGASLRKGDHGALYDTEAVTRDLAEMADLHSALSFVIEHHVPIGSPADIAAPTQLPQAFLMELAYPLDEPTAGLESPEFRLSAGDLRPAGASLTTLITPAGIEATLHVVMDDGGELEIYFRTAKPHGQRERHPRREIRGVEIDGDCISAAVRCIRGERSSGGTA